MGAKDIKNRPLISVIIPTYNCADYLANAIDSVFSQSINNLEVVIVDDGSLDNTREIVRLYDGRLRYLYQENAGVSVARNTGIAAATGTYVAFLDADDVWRPSKLERQLAELERRPGFRVCHSSFELCDATLNPYRVVYSQPETSALEDLLTRGNVIGTPSSVLCERSLFATAGVFDPELSQCADWDMWVRLSVLTDFAYVREPLVFYRQHGSNMSRDAALLERDSLLVLRKGFDLPNVPVAVRARRRFAFARNYMVLAGNYFQARRYRDFARCAARAVVMDYRQIRRLLTYPARLTGQLLPRWKGKAIQHLESKLRVRQ